MPGLMTLYDVVWRQYLKADKSPALTLEASAAWLSAPAPVDVTLAGAS